MAINYIQLAKDLLKQKSQQLYNTTQAIGQQVNNRINAFDQAHPINLSPQAQKVANVVLPAAARLSSGVMNAPKNVVQNTPLGKGIAGFTNSASMGLVNIPTNNTNNVFNRPTELVGKLAGFTVPYSPFGKGMGLVGKAGEKVATKAALTVAPKIGVRSLSVARGIGGELAQTLGYAAASKLTSDIGLNNSKDQFAPGNLAQNALAGIGLRGLSSKSLAPTVMGIFGKNDEATRNLTEIDTLVDMFKMGNKDQKQKAKELIRLAAERSAPKDAMEKYIDQPLKLARAIQKNLTSKRPQFNNTVNNLVGENQVQTQAVQPEQFNPQQYVKEMSQKQQDARGSITTSLGQKAKGFLADVKEKMVDSLSPIEDALTSAEKKYNFKVLPSQDVRIQFDRVLRSKTLASKFAEDNGLVDAIKNAPDINALDQYMIAKQASQVAAMGKETGRDITKDKMLVDALAPQYEGIAKQVNNYSRNLLNYAVESGLVNKKTADSLIKQYPDYVPLNRIFSEDEGVGVQGLGKSLASISSQNVVKKLEGSKREITSPIESLLLKTQTAFAEGEKNKAAKMLASYKDLPGFEGMIKELKQHKETINRISKKGNPFKMTVTKNDQAPHTISYLEDGVKKTFAVTSEIETAAKNMNAEQMGLIGKIFSVPTRILQVGATGLNVPFVVTNVLKDQMTTLVNSNKATRTSMLNPVNFTRALFSALKHDDLYDEVVRAGAGGTSFDIAREAPNLTVQKIRSNRNLQSKVKYTVTHPGELLRAVEDIIGRGEEVARIQNYKGTKDAFMNEGRTMADSELLAAKAARENTANFARKGSWGRVLNWMIPFFNSGVQGARQTVRSFQNDPKGTSFKVAGALFMPAAVATSWNLSDPQRATVYQDIPDYEKQDNIIIIPPNPTQNSKGVWNVIKIPIPPGLSNLTSLVRRPIEQAHGLDPVKFGEIANNLITAGTSIDLSSPNKLASTFTPQIAKPVVEGVTNTNLYTGQKIVPDYMKNLPTDAQVKPGTPFMARKIGSLLNVSPLMVENAAGTIGGGVGKQVIGKESIVGNLQRRFTQAQGGSLVGKIFDESDKVMGVETQVKNLLKSGQVDEAKNLVVQNKDVLKKAEMLKKFRTDVSDAYTMRRKVEADTRLSPEQKQKVLSLIQNRLNTISKAYSMYEGGGK